VLEEMPVARQTLLSHLHLNAHKKSQAGKADCPSPDGRTASFPVNDVRLHGLLYKNHPFKIDAK
jgi:hypothetical protein